MKTILFAMLLAISVAFLSCSTGGDDKIGCTKAAKPSYDYEELDSICKSEQRKLVFVVDLDPYTGEIDWDYVYSHLPWYVPGSGQLSEYTEASSTGYFYCNVGGTEMTLEEYGFHREEYLRKYYEELNKSTRILPIPCVVGNGVALLTDEEIAELMETYYGLAIEDYIEPIPAVPAYPGHIPDNTEGNAGTYCEE